MFQCGKYSVAYVLNRYHSYKMLSAAKFGLNYLTNVSMGANSVDPEQTVEQSDLGPHCLSKT